MSSVSTPTTSKARAVDYVYFAAVGAYLTAAMLALLVTGRLDPGVTFRKVVAAAFRKRTSGTLAGIKAERGSCYVAAMPIGPISDAEGRSRIRLFEDGKELGPGHANHEEIRGSGGGRFSHWRTNLYFSASDNSDPRTNGRTYTFSE